MCNTKKIYSFPPHIIYNKKNYTKKLEKEMEQLYFLYYDCLSYSLPLKYQVILKEKMFQKKKL